MTTHTYRPYPGPITLDTLPDLFAHHAATAGGWRMEADPAGDGGDSGGTGTGTATAPDATAPPSPDGGGKQQPDPNNVIKQFTQADLDRVLNERIARETAKYETQIKELKESAGRTETEKLTAERDRYKEAADAATTTAAERLAKAEAKVAAMAAGGRDDRLNAIMAQADLTDCVTDNGDAVHVSSRPGKEEGRVAGRDGRRPYLRLDPWTLEGDIGSVGHTVHVTYGERWEINQP